MAAEREMRDFTRRLFQGSPDLSVLTLAMVRRKYLAHVGRESLMREEKELLKQLVEEELLRMQQLDDSSSNGESPNPENARDTPEARAEKRPRSGSNSSGGGPKDTARKKQRLDQGSEASSDGEDSGIDSRKPKLADAQGETGKSRRTGSWEDEGDSGAEETPDLGGTGRESDSKWAATSEGMKQPPRRTEGAKAQDRLGQKRAREAERRGDCGEQEGKANGGITAQSKEESGSESVEEEECKRQKQTGKTGARKAKRRSDSEEEGDSKKKGRMKAWGKEVGSDSEMEEKECQNRKGAGKKGTRKAGRWSDSEEEENKETIKSQREEESGSEEEGRSRKQAGKKGAKKAERRSDSEAEEVGSRKRGRVKALKGEGSGSEEEEGRSRKPAGKKGAKKAELERRKRRTKAQSEEGSGREEEEGKSRKETGRGKAERDSESEEEERKPRLKAEEEGKARQRGSSETDKDSSSSSSVQDENNSPNPGSRRKKGKAEEHPAVRRLKRYILACGVRRNYRKLLAGCRSVKQRVGVLRRELEAIGLQGNPSLERCRALRLHLEEAAEVAALDMGNIIASDGRPRRRNIWSLYSTPPAIPPASPPDADGGLPSRRPTDWSSLRGVISSDGESD